MFCLPIALWAEIRYLCIQKSCSLPNCPGVNALTKTGADHQVPNVHNNMEKTIMNDREEAEFREQADGFFDNMDRDEMEDWFEGDA